jgi:asparagine synthase (glutamine-hydrolysing)
MADALAHRGPDSSGLECRGSCLLVNTRLAIIDLSASGCQPMSNEDQRIWITYNGETYNAAELRRELLARGHRFRSATDTEVVLHLYEEMGERCVERLRGMFAFAIWDENARRLVLARDRLGIKPLYFALTPDGVLFASEIKALLASGLVRRKLDAAGLRVFLQLGHVPPPWTAIENVHPLEPGHVAVWQSGQWTSRAYWTVRGVMRKRVAPVRHDLAAQLGEVFLDVVRHHVVSDVPIAIFLSGGVDSACLAAAFRRTGVENLTAVTVGFAEREFDESELSRRTAEAFGIPHRVITLPAQEVAGQLDHAIWAMDQPTVDGLNSYWISRLVAGAGFKVALSGQGGDELFGGYESLKWFERFNSVARLMRPLPAEMFTWFLGQNALPFRWRKLSYLLEAEDSLVASQLAVKVLFPEEDVRRLLAGEGAANGDISEARSHLAQWAQSVAGEELLETLAYMDVHTHLQPRLLRDMDAMSMAHSLEVRPVFLDHQLVEFLLMVPASVRIRQKRLLLEAVRPFLPEGFWEDLQSRGKRTFTFPFVRWLATSLREAMEQTFAPERLRGTGVLEPAPMAELWQRYKGSPGAVGWSRIWSLFVLQRWCEVMQVTP